jgi:hypothetical protein
MDDVKPLRRVSGSALSRLRASAWAQEGVLRPHAPCRSPRSVHSLLETMHYSDMESCPPVLWSRKIGRAHGSPSKANMAGRQRRLPGHRTVVALHDNTWRFDATDRGAARAGTVSVIDLLTAAAATRARPRRTRAAGVYHRTHRRSFTASPDKIRP